MGDVPPRGAARLLHPSVIVALVLGAFVGCGVGRVSEVSPEEIPSLQAQLAETPTDGRLLLRYSAALFAAGQCDSARVVARRGAARVRESALGPMIMGQCLEQAGDYEEALAIYRRYLAAYGDKRGAGAIRARELIATRAQANTRAREARQREAELTQVAADPNIVAVLPLEIVGDSMYLPLSRGLAQILTSDLALLQRFRMVERIQVGALLDELELAQTQRVDPSTAARVGRLLQAGRLVQGLAAIPPEGQTRLEAQVVMSDGEITSPEAVSGGLRDLLRMEKDLVIGIANQLGYMLSVAERRMILENGTQSLAAFLAYSRGLLAEEAGQYGAAAQHYQEAVQADPSFDMARDKYEASTLAPVVEQAPPTAVTVTAAQSAPDPIPIFEGTVQSPVTQAMGTSELDVASTQGEQTRVVDQTQTTTQATTTTASNPPPIVVYQGESPTRTGIIRIIFRLP